MGRILFESHQLRMRYVPGRDFGTVVITFMHWSEQPRKDRAGFAEAFLAAEGLAAIHITCAENAWYQHPEMRHLDVVLEPVLRLYDRRVSYGSSMGAYAALMFAGLTRSDVVIALSPQYSIDPEKSAYDKSWLHIGRKLSFCCDDLAEFPSRAEAFVLFDPRHVDGIHGEAIARERSVRLIPVDGASHPASEFLHGIGMLKPTVLSLIRGSFDEAAFRFELRRASRRSPRYYCALAARARDPQRKLRLYEAGERLFPGDFFICLHRARTLHALRRHAEAEIDYRRALAAQPRHGWTMIWLAELCLELERRDEACRLAQEAMAAMPQHEQLQAVAAALADKAAARPGA